MKARLATAAFLVAAATASAALNAYRTGISLPQAVKLMDGSVLPAGPYDVEIHYKGTGNAAELWFFQKGNLKGKSPAEARGFAAKGNAEGGDPHRQANKVAGCKWVPPAAPDTFGWEKSGFPAGRKGNAAPGGNATLKLSFDSANSSAGFVALLPYVEQLSK